MLPAITLEHLPSRYDVRRLSVNRYLSRYVRRVVSMWQMMFEFLELI